MLKTLICNPTGSIAAAATTSLPEQVAGGKNWDYRYAWIRDAAYTMSALRRFGIREETHAAVGWLLRTARQRRPAMGFSSVWTAQPRIRCASMRRPAGAVSDGGHR